MAIIFIAQKKKQKAAAIMTTAVLVVVLLLTPLVILSPLFSLAPQEVVPQRNFPTSVYIDFSVINSQKINQLEPFLKIEKTFSYTLEDQSKKPLNGVISAFDLNGAIVLLQARGLKILSIQEVLPGNSEPFAPPQLGL